MNVRRPGGGRVGASPQKENGYTAIANEIMEALARFRIPGEARQVLDVIIRKTYGYGKLVDTISTSQFSELTGLPKQYIHKVRKRLLYANLITVYKNEYSQTLSYSFQKDHTKWNSIQKKILCIKKGMDKKGRNCTQKVTQTVPNIPTTITINKYTKEIHEFFDYFILKTKKKLHLNPPRAAIIKSRLKEGRTLDELKKAVDNFIQDTWSDRHKYIDVVYCIGIRNKVDNLERWLNIPAKKKERGDV